MMALCDTKQDIWVSPKGILLFPLLNVLYYRMSSTGLLPKSKPTPTGLSNEFCLELYQWEEIAEGEDWAEETTILAFPFVFLTFYRSKKPDKLYWQLSLRAKNNSNWQEIFYRKESSTKSLKKGQKLEKVKFTSALASRKRQTAIWVV